MFVTLNEKFQVTIPKEITTALYLKEGDQFEAAEQDGKIVLSSVVVYVQERINALKESVKEMKKAVESGKQPVFDSVDDLFAELDR